MNRTEGLDVEYNNYTEKDYSSFVVPLGVHFDQLDEVITIAAAVCLALALVCFLSILGCRRVQQSKWLRNTDTALELDIDNELKSVADARQQDIENHQKHITMSLREMDAETGKDTRCEKCRQCDVCAARMMECKKSKYRDTPSNDEADVSRL